MQEVTAVAMLTVVKRPTKSEPLPSSVFVFDGGGRMFPVYFPAKEPDRKVFLPIVTR